MFTHVGSVRDAASSGTSASVTHGLTINNGDLVVAHVNSNATDPVSPDADSGGTWTEHVDETPPGETGRQGLFSKIANGSEPATYSVTVGNAQWDLIVKVFRPSAGTPTVDAAATTHIEPASNPNLIIGAIGGAVISDGAVSIVFGGKDNRSAGDTLFSTADNSYVGVIGGTGFQEHAGAHRIYTTGQTFSGAVTIDAAASSQTDKCYSVHISFVESVGGGTTISAGTASAEWDGKTADIAVGKTVSADVAGAEFFALNADVSLSTTVSAGLAQIEATGQTASIQAGNTVSAQVARIAATARQAAITLAKTVSAGVAGIEATANAATVAITNFTSANTAQAAFATHQATVTSTVEIRSSHKSGLRFGFPFGM